MIALVIIASGDLKQGIDLKGGSEAVLQLEHPISDDQLTALVKNATGAQIVTVTTASNNQATVDITGEAANVVALSKAINGVATIQTNPVCRAAFK